MSSPLFPELPVVWRLSAAWASKVIDCTAYGVSTRCHGQCCKTQGFWPPKASGTGQCANLGPTGCILGADKPVTCLIYPFRLKNDMLVLHGRALTGCCKPNYKQGALTIAEANRGNFAILFGEEIANAIVRNTRAGIDTRIPVPQWVLKSLADEQRWEAANATPPGRADMHKTPPAGNPLNILQ